MKRRATCSGGGAFAWGFELACLMWHLLQNIIFDRLDGVSGGALAVWSFATFGKDARRFQSKIKKTKQIYKRQSVFKLVLSLAGWGSANGIYDYDALEEFMLEECGDRKLNVEIGIGVYDMAAGVQKTLVFQKGTPAKLAVSAVRKAMSIPMLVQINEPFLSDSGPTDSIVYKDIVRDLHNWQEVRVFSIHHHKPVKTPLEKLRKFRLMDMLGFLFGHSTNETFKNDHIHLTEACRLGNVKMVTIQPEKEFEVYEFEYDGIKGAYDHGLEMCEKWRLS